MLAVLGRSWSLCWRSWAALGPYVGGLGLLLGPMLAVLGCSWGLSWWSWPLLEPKLAVLGRIRAKVAQTRAGAGSVRGPDSEVPEVSEARGPGTYFFCRYMFFSYFFTRRAR